MVLDVLCHQYFLDSELSVHHIVPRALSGDSIVRNMHYSMSQNEKSAIYQVYTESMHVNVCIIKARKLANFQLLNPTPPTVNPPLPQYSPRTIPLAQSIPPLSPSHPISLASQALIPFRIICVVGKTTYNPLIFSLCYFLNQIDSIFSL